MKIVYCEPYDWAKIMEIEDNPPLKTLQGLVKGYIEVYSPLYSEEHGDYVLVCNDEGKLLNMEPNRLLCDENKCPVELIQGPFFLCKFGEDDFEGLTDEEADYLAHLYDPKIVILQGEVQQ